jgi:hypothetical protein
MSEQERKERAEACGDRVAARGHMCGGCYDQFYCGVSRKMAAKNPVGAKLLRDVVLTIATHGAYRPERQ